MWKCLCVFLPILFLACGRMTTTNIASDNPKRAIIFVPGFKGSYLVKDDGGKAWISAGEALFGSTSLAIANPALKISNIPLRVDGVLTRIGVIPLIYGVEVYGSFLERLREDFPGSDVIEMPYDWRQDNMLAVRMLADLVAQQKAKGAAVAIVAHSMGALAAAYYLRYGTQDFMMAKENWFGAREVDRVVIAGTPFRGSVEMFHDMQFGDRTALNRTLLSAESLSSFASSYQLLPVFPESAIIAHAPVDVFDAALWRKYSWGLLRDLSGLNDAEIQAREEFTRENLQRAKQLHFLLQKSSDAALDKRLPLLNIVGVDRPVNAKVHWDEALPGPDYRRLVSEFGDGVITAEGAAVPQGFLPTCDVREHRVTSTHARLFTEDDGYEEVVRFVRGK